ncbi:MAG: glycosyltransferase family 39 protein, partial [Acetobacter sp.]|nr:glycosyltransferase family 39 protein [Acetobacter sp.]
MRYRAHLFGVSKEYCLRRKMTAFWLCVLMAITGLRWLLSAYVPLSPDEAYYRIWALAPAAGYLDHPPMVALCMRLGMFIGGDTAFGLRFMAPLLTAMSSLFLAAAAFTWLGRESSYLSAGVRTAVLLNTTLAIGIEAMIMTPDIPLIFFISVMLWLLAR